MKVIVEIDEARFKDIQRIAEVQLEMSHFQTAEQIIAKGIPLEQEPKTGRWVVTDDDLVYCSECEDSYYPRPIDASWYYCPHCGAKME